MSNDKWADYAITAIRYNRNRTHIEYLQVRQDDGNTLGFPLSRSRSQIVNLIKTGTTFVTAYERGAKWQRGDNVHVVVINGISYLRTDGNRVSKDNLGNLPEF